MKKILLLILLTSSIESKPFDTFLNSLKSNYECIELGDECICCNVLEGQTIFISKTCATGKGYTNIFTTKCRNLRRHGFIIHNEFD